MKKIFLISCGVAMFLVAGCGARDITDNDIIASTQMENAKSKCYAAVAAQSTADSAMIESVKLDDRAMLTMFYFSNRQTATLISAFTGKNIDKCAGTNLWDFQIAETQAKNKALSVGLGHLVTGVKWIAGAWVAVEVVNKVDSSYSSSEYSTSESTATTHENSGNSLAAPAFVK